MRHPYLNRNGIRRLALAFAVPLMLSGCGTVDSAQEGGVDEGRIVIGIHGPKSGPAAAFTSGAVTGFQLYVNRVNERGGINGRIVEVAHADDQYSVPGGAAAARQLSDDVFLAYNIIGADPAIGALPEFERRGIPYLSVALPLAQAQKSGVAFVFPTPLELLAEALPSFIQHRLDPSGATTVGVMWENQDIMRDMLAHFTETAKEAGLDIVATESFDRDATTYVPNVQRIKDAGADLVVLLGGVAVPGVLKAASSIGYEPTWTGAGAWTFDMINAASGGLMEGIEALRAGPVADAPDYQDFLTELHQEQEAPLPTDEIAYSGWTGARFIEQLLRRLGQDVTRDRLFDELENGELAKDPISLGPAMPPIWYGKDRRYGSSAALPSKVVNGHWTSNGEPASRFK